MNDLEKKVLVVFVLLLSITAINISTIFVIDGPGGSFSSQKIIGTLSSLSIVAISFSGLTAVLFLSFFYPGKRYKKKR